MIRFIKYFIASLILLFTFGSFLFTGKAHAACTQDPTLINLGHVDGVRSVKYHIQIINNCSGTNTFEVRITHYPTKSDGDTLPNGVSQFHGFYKVNGGSQDVPGNISVNGSNDFYITIIRDLNYYHPDGLYNPVRIKAELASNSNVSDSIGVDYIVANKPDLEISSFNFPGGSSCSTSDVTLKIKNIGWKSVTGNFDVKVNNGGGNTRTRRVTQTVTHNEVIDMSSLFANMPIPPPGNYKATATVDVNDEINEEDEGNNDDTDSYTSTSTPCTTPVPTKVPTKTPTNAPTKALTGTPTPTRNPLATPTRVPTSTPIPTPTPITSSSSWFNGIGGDMRVDNGLINRIPPGNYFSELDLRLSPGVVFGTSMDLGGNLNAKSSIRGWFVGNNKFASNVVHTSYAQMNSNITKTGIFRTQPAIILFGGSNPPCISGGGPNCDLDTDLSGGIYTSDRDVTINKASPNYNFKANNNYIFLIDGNLRIETNLIVPQGSTVMFFVSGNITVADNVTRIEGVYSADNNFLVQGVSTGFDQQLEIQGSVIANAALRQNSGNFPGTFKNERSLADNSLQAVKIRFRPDFVLNAPELIRVGDGLRHEIAPGE